MKYSSLVEFIYLFFSFSRSAARWRARRRSFVPRQPQYGRYSGISRISGRFFFTVVTTVAEMSV